MHVYAYIKTVGTYKRRILVDIPFAFFVWQEVNAVQLDDFSLAPVPIYKNGEDLTLQTLKKLRVCATYCNNVSHRLIRGR